MTRRGHDVLVVPMYPRGPLVHGDVVPLMKRVVSRPLFGPDILKSAGSEIARNPAAAIRSLAPLFRSRNLMILLKNLAVYPKGLWLAALARRWGAEHMHVHWAASTATMALVAGQVSGIPWSVTCHRWDIVENNLLGMKAERAAFLRFISRSGLRMAKSLGIRLRDSRTFVLNMSVPIVSAEAGTDEPDCAALPTVVMCPANLIAVKGHRYLIEALGTLTERGVGIEAWFAGDGVLRKELEREVEVRGLSDRVRFFGHLPHSELMRLYREEGSRLIVVLPSVDLGNGQHEGIPVSLIEAMGYGIPVVSTTTGGIPELLEGGAGLLIPPQASHALADGIQQLIENSELRKRLVQAGRERVEKEFAVDKVVAELVARFGACSKGQAGMGKYECS